MTLALSSPGILSRLVVSDIAPTRTSLSPSCIRHLNAMAKIEDPTTGVRTREDASRVLEGVEKVCFLILLLTFNLTLR